MKNPSYDLLAVCKSGYRTPITVTKHKPNSSYEIVAWLDLFTGKNNDSVSLLEKVCDHQCDTPNRGILTVWKLLNPVEMTKGRFYEAARRLSGGSIIGFELWFISDQEVASSIDKPLLESRERTS